MQIPQDAVLLRIFLRADRRYRRRSLHEAITLKAREMQLAGATAIRGPLGFGRSGRLHAAAGLRFIEDLPMIIEIVDSEEKIAAFLPMLHGMIGSALVTQKKVKVLRYERAPGPAGSPAPSRGARLEPADNGS